MEEPRPPTDDFTALWQSVCRGDDRASAALHRRYATRLYALAARRLDAWTAADRGPEDLVQSAFRSFFRSCRAGELHPESWEGLWALLALITRRKCNHRRSYLAAARRRQASERSAVASTVDPADDRPGPEDAAIFAETLDRWLHALGPDERAIVSLGLQGYDSPTIAGHLGRSERTVRRVRNHARTLLLRMTARDEMVAGGAELSRPPD